MENPKNHFKRALQAGKTQIGFWATLSSNYTAEVVAGAGFDWILIDTEHSPADIECVLGQLQAIAPYPTSAVVRIPWNDMVTIKRTLDAGAQSLLIPYVNNAEEARAAVSYARYPTAGVRGVAGATRASRFGRVKNYFDNASADICVLVQVETKEALDQIEAIAAVDGVDGIFIGPADLHASFGMVGERAHKDIVPIIEKAVQRIKKAGKAPGYLIDEAAAQHWIDVGVQFIAVGSDVGVLARGAEALAAKFKAANP